ncbi:MAG: 1-acyl-sn-glycerol-3-phosphate acyltransferase [Fibrobacter sp.]|nr:1-acyl-sn-glycerol-3-phosphate acyltransferase [Fibrobacter sp.]
MRLKNFLLALIFFASISISFVIVAPFLILAFGITMQRNKAIVVGSAFFKTLLPILGIHPIVEGKHNIPKGRNFVLLSNHQSFLDIGVLLHEVHPIAFLAKKELFRIPIFGFVLRFIGSLPIDRADRRANVHIAERMAINIKKGFNYCVYPEGTRSTTGELLPFKNGIFRIIQKSPVAVLPVTIYGTGEILPKKGFKLFPKRPRIIIHPLIETEQIEKWNLDEFKSAVRHRIQLGLDMAKEL